MMLLLQPTTFSATKLSQTKSTKKYPIRNQSDPLILYNTVITLRDRVIKYPGEKDQILYNLNSSNGNEYYLQE